MFSGALRAMTVTPNPLQKCPTFLTLSLLFGFFKSPFFFVLVQCRSLPSYMTELLGLGRRGASRRCHRCGAVGSVLLWRSRFIYAVLRWRVSWTSAGSGGVLEEHGGFKSVNHFDLLKYYAAVSCHFVFSPALTSLDTSTTRSSLFSPSLSWK